MIYSIKFTHNFNHPNWTDCPHCNLIRKNTKIADLLITKLPTEYGFYETTETKKLADDDKRDLYTIMEYTIHTTPLKVGDTILVRGNDFKVVVRRTGMNDYKVSFSVE